MAASIGISLAIVKLASTKKLKVNENLLKAVNMFSAGVLSAATLILVLEKLVNKISKWNLD